MSKRLLVLTHDVLSPVFDRRIVQTMQVWQERGWRVTCVASRNSSPPSPPPIRDVEWRLVDERALPSPCDPVWTSLLHENALLKRPFHTVNLETQSGKRTHRWWRKSYRWAMRQHYFSIINFIAKHVAKSMRTMTPRALSLELRNFPPLEWYPLPYTEALLRVADEEHDVVLACDLVTAPAAMTLSARYGSLLLYDMHEHYTEQKVFTQKQKRILEHWEEATLASAFLAYTVSPAIAADLQRKYGLAETPGVITNAVRVDQPVTRRSGLLRQAVNAGPSDRVLLYHGGIVPYRNLDVLLDAFAEVAPPDVVLVFMGYGDMSHVKASLARARRQARVEVLPAVPASELNHWVADADAVVIPYPALDLNTKFCAPNKLYDCIALNVPLLINDELYNVRSIVKRYGLGEAVDFSNVASAAKGLSTWFRDSSEGGGQGDFDAARAEVGWEAQDARLRTWIAQVEEELERRNAGAAGESDLAIAREGMAG